MILLEIKTYVKQRGQVSLRDVAAKFDLTEAAAKEMLTHWERKGKIEQIENTCHCCSCSCPEKENSSSCGAVYRWK